MPWRKALQTTVFLLALCVFGAGLLLALVQRHAELRVIARTSRRLSQFAPEVGALLQQEQQQTLLEASAASEHTQQLSSSSISSSDPDTAVQQLLSGDRKRLIESAQQLADQVEHGLHSRAAVARELHVTTGISGHTASHSHLAAGTQPLKMMSSRGLAGPLANSLQSSFKNAWSAYNRALLVRPLATKIMTGVVGTIIGDGIAQYSSYRMSLPVPHKTAKQSKVPAFEYDFPRLARLLIWTASFATPLAHYWFQFLDTRIMPQAPTSMRAVAAKLLLDQGFMAPLGTSLFFMAMKVLEGQPEKAIPEVRSKLWPVMLANWSVWPLANAINFALIPPSQRILYVNVLAIAWSAFMSHMANKPAGSATAPAKPVHAAHHQHAHGVNMRHLEPAGSGVKIS